MELRIGVVGIVLDDPKNDAQKVNAILSKFSDIIRGRMGLPFEDDNISVISLVVKGDTNRIGALTGSLGQLERVAVKSALTSKVLH
ncbi:MAG: iron-only hydrogenase system regulator [Clostridia bacterium]|nr:iron-only hydrogenase system regulator [Clostridia bacterium]